MRLSYFRSGKGKVAQDIIINILASSISTAILNILVYPFLARKYTSDEYGYILTAIGVINLLFSSIGNSLNNIRLLKNRTAGKKNQLNPYNFLVVISSIIGAIVGTIIIYFILPLNYVNICLVLLTIFIGNLRAYYIVTFRLELNYKKQLISNVFLSIGYIVGVFSINYINFWPLPFLIGELTSLIYVYFNSGLFHEGFSCRKDIDGITKSFLILLSCNILANMLVYLDRFIINPTLGPESVSTFTVASFWGRCFSPFIAPIAMVILSYLSKEGSTIDLNRYNRLFKVTFIPIGILIILGLWIGPIITRLLYPTIIDSAERFIFLASAGALIGCATNLINPMIMSVCKMKDLFVLQTVQFVAYVVIAYFGAKSSGLVGFCYAVIVINIFKVISSYYFGYIRIKRSTSNMAEEQSME